MMLESEICISDENIKNKYLQEGTRLDGETVVPGNINKNEV